MTLHCVRWHAKPEPFKRDIKPERHLVKGDSVVGNLVLDVELSKPLLPVEVVPLTRVELNQLQCAQVRQQSGRRDVFGVSLSTPPRYGNVRHARLQVNAAQNASEQLIGL